MARARHPLERRVVALSTLANLALIAGAVAAIALAPGWLSSHPSVAQLAVRVRLVAIVAVLVVPALGLLRSGRWMMIQLNSVRLGPDQLPAVHAILERHCRVLRIPPPALYVSGLPGLGVSDGIALRRGRVRAIVLGEKLFDGTGDLAAREDVFAFVIGHELGRLLLGHASWWSELFLGYLRHIPVLRLPVAMVETYSRDRFAALLAPGSVSALALMASGGEIYGSIDVGAFARDALAPGRRPWQARVGAMLRREPHLVDRVRELHRCGLFEPRQAGGPPQEDPRRRAGAAGSGPA